MATPYDIHQQTLEEQLSWMNTVLPSGHGGSGGTEVGTKAPTFTWKGKEYSCVSSWRKGRYLDQGGLVITDELVLTLLEAMDDPGPEPLQMIEFQETQMRIQYVSLASGKFPTLICWNPARGA